MADTNDKDLTIMKVVKDEEGLKLVLESALKRIITLEDRVEKLEDDLQTAIDFQSPFKALKGWVVSGIGTAVAMMVGAYLMGLFK